MRLCRLLTVTLLLALLSSCGDDIAGCQRGADEWRAGEKTSLEQKINVLVSMGADMDWGSVLEIAHGRKSGHVAYADSDVPKELVVAAGGDPDGKPLESIAVWFDLLSGHPSPKFTPEQRRQFDSFISRNGTEHARFERDQIALARARLDLERVNALYMERIRSCGRRADR